MDVLPNFTEGFQFNLSAGSCTLITRRKLNWQEQVVWR